MPFGSSTRSLGRILANGSRTAQRNELYARSWQRYMTIASKHVQSNASTSPRSISSSSLNPNVPSYSSTTAESSASSAVRELEQLAASKPKAPPKDHDSLPWYLRSHPPTEAVHQTLDIPPIPSDAPPLLEPILTHLVTSRSPVSDLTLLDLRAMEDPTPALGSNLIMVVATARSGQHVHAFSDRFCRWLRSEYKFRPTADGLLGRQTIKVWKRRAAKKARALALAGAGAGGIDDRIGWKIALSDWICVNVGNLPAAPGAVKVKKIQEGFVGFDSTSDKVTVVVHIMTEERRKELNLEGFWNNKLARRFVLPTPGAIEGVHHVGDKAVFDRAAAGDDQDDAGDEIENEEFDEDEEEEYDDDYEDEDEDAYEDDEEDRGRNP